MTLRIISSNITFLKISLVFLTFAKYRFVKSLGNILKTNTVITIFQEINANDFNAKVINAEEINAVEELLLYFFNEIYAVSTSGFQTI